MDPVPQPVIKNAAAVAVTLFVLGQIAAVTSFYGWWTPSGDELLLWADVAGTVVGLALLVQAWFVHQRVTPNENVALTKDQAACLSDGADPGKPAPDPDGGRYL